MSQNIKILAVGDSSLIKSQLLSAFVFEERDNMYRNTVFDNYSGEIAIEDENEIIKYSLWYNC